MTKDIISTLILLAVFITLTFSALTSYKSAKIYEDTYKQFAQEQTIQNSVKKYKRDVKWFYWCPFR